MKTTNNNSDKVIVKFHVGRGGRHFNAGYLTFVGFERIDEGSAFDKLFLSEDETHYLDASGNEVGLTVAEAETGIGTINQDNDYDTTFAVYLEDCDSRQLAAIAEENPWGLKGALEKSNFFEDNSVIDILDAFNKLPFAVSEGYSENTLEYVGIEEITEEEYDFYEAEHQESVGGKYYKLS